MTLASFQEYLPLGDLWKIVVTCVAVAVVSPVAAAFVITGFEGQAKAHADGRSRRAPDLRIALGVLILAALIAFGILALIRH